MPSAQVIDLSPTPRQPTNLENTVGEFVQGYRQDRQQARESDALRDIYSQYQSDGQNLDRLFSDIQSNTDISPTAKVQNINQILAFKKHNSELQKNASKELAAKRKEEDNAAQARYYEKSRGLEENSLAAFNNNPSGAERASRPKTDKNPIGGLGGTPLKQEESQDIQSVLADNPDASAEELEIAFNEAGIIPGRVSGIIESRRRKEETEAKNKNEEKKLTRKEELDFHKETQKYDEALYKNVKAAKGQLDVVKTIDKAIQSGNVKPTSWTNIFKGFGEVGDRISKAIQNKDETALTTSIPSLLEGWKEVFGVRLSDADLKIIEDKLPSIGRNVESNKAILKILKKYGEQTLLRGRIADELKAENKGLRPLDYIGKIEKRFDEYTEPVEILNPKTGRMIQIPAYKYKSALEEARRLSNE